MVLFLPQQQSANNQLAQQLGLGLGQGISNFTDALMSKRSRGRENEAAKRLGIDLEGIEDPQTRRQLLVENLKNQQQEQKDFKSQILEDEAAQVIEEQFGPKAAKLFRASPQGAKTHIIKNLLENRMRGMDIENQMGLTGEEETSQFPYEMIEDLDVEELPKEKKTKIIDYDKGLTPKERFQRGEARYGKNLPLQQEDFEKYQSTQNQREELNILEELSPKIGSLQRLNINPQTGELLIPSLASPEAQRFVKTINDFTTQAKSSYGARVTNFDLQQFMKRLPTLANSEEGRKQIIQQMKILNEISALYHQELDSVLNQHGGIRHIDYDQAQRLARKKIEPKLKEYKKQLHDIGKEQSKEYNAAIKEKRNNTPKGLVLIEIDGEQGYVPQGELKKAIEEGAVVL